MGTLHIPLGKEVPLPQVFADMPDSVKALIRKGFSKFAELPPASQAVVLRAAVESTGQQKLKDEDKIAESIGISAQDASRSIASLGLLIALSLTRPDQDIEHVFNAMVDAGIIAAQDRDPVLKLIPAIGEHKPELKQALKKQELSNAVLPSFDEFEAVLDIRIGDKDGVGIVTPVAIAFLDTDSRDHRLWFQLSKQDIESMIATLNGLLERFKQAEEIIKNWPAKAGGV